MHIHEVIVQVGDVEAAIAFYTDVVGFTYVRTVEHEGAKVVELDADGQRVTLVPSRAPGVRLALGTRDARAEQRRLRRAGVTMHAKSPVEVAGGAWLSFEDPWGNRLGYWQPPTPASS
ncbi:MAG TPA: VOC family protein [Egibacteraceae bacterium]|nr:VOC family protein [Actinomycetota bacterium]HWB72162.1 VOC family protein [Egibacteraceae bacterium]